MNAFEVFMFMELVQEYAEAYYWAEALGTNKAYCARGAALERVEAEVLNLLDCPPL